MAIDFSTDSGKSIAISRSGFYDLDMAIDFLISPYNQSIDYIGLHICRRPSAPIINRLIKQAPICRCPCPIINRLIINPCIYARVPALITNRLIIKPCIYAGAPPL